MNGKYVITFLSELSLERYGSQVPLFLSDTLYQPCPWPPVSIMCYPTPIPRSNTKLYPPISLEKGARPPTAPKS